MRLWPRVKPYRWPLAFATVTLVASGLLALAFPMAVRYLLDAAFVERNRAMLDRIAIGLVVLFIVQAVLNYVQTYLLSAVGERSVAGLRQELFAKLLDMPPGFFAERRTGELTSRLTSDVGLLQGVLSHQISEFARQILSLVGGIVLLTYLQPRLTLTALAVSPLVVGSAIFFGRRLRNITTGVQDRLAEATGVAEEAFSQIRTVQSFVQEPTERARYADRVAASVRIAIKRARVRGVFFGMLTLSTFAGITFVLWQGGLLVLDGQLSAGSLVSFLLYTITIAASIGALASSFSAYQEAVGAAERVFEILEMDPAIADPPVPVPLMTPVAGRVAFEGVYFRYHEDAHAAVDAGGHRSRGGAGRGRGAGRAFGRGQDDAGLAAPPFLGRGSAGTSGSTATTCARSGWRTCGVRSGWCRRSRRCSAARSGRTSPTPGPGASAGAVEAAARAAHAHEFVERLPQGYDTRGGRAGGQALRRTAPAGGDRAGDPQGSGGADPGRGDQQPGHRERAADRGRARAGCWWAGRR